MRIEQLMFSTLGLFCACSEMEKSAKETEAEKLDETSCSNWEEATQVGAIVDNSLDEISGLAVSRKHQNVLWALEDSGAEALLTALNHSGETIGTVTVKDVINTDWEDMAISPCSEGQCIWIGDFGDNDEERENVQLIRLVEPDITTLSSNPLEVEATIYDFSYPQGPQNAEAMGVTAGGDPMIITKRNDGTGQIYLLENLRETEVNTATLIGELEIDSEGGHPHKITAADISSQGSELFVRTYSGIYAYPLEEKELSSAMNISPLKLTPGIEIQGESIAHDPHSGGIWHVSEFPNQPLYHLNCSN